MQTNRLGRRGQGNRGDAKVLRTGIPAYRIDRIRRWTAASLMIAALSTPRLGRAQSADVVTSPPNIVVPPYEGIPAGRFGGLEGSRLCGASKRPVGRLVQPGWVVARQRRANHR